MTDVTFDLVLADSKSATRKQAFQYAAGELSRMIGIGQRVLADKLLDKDRQANCSIGAGVAVADLRLSSLTQPLCVLVRLNHKIDFEAPDHEAVDLLALMLSPERDGPQHLARLSKLSRQLRDAALCDGIRQFKKPEEIRAYLKSRQQSKLTVRRAA